MYKIYSISYDLNKAGKDYEGLIAAIKKYPDWCSPTKSYWLIATNNSAEQVYEYLRPHLDADDRILIARFMGDRQGWLAKPIWDWMKKYLPNTVPA